MARHSEKAISTTLRSASVPMARITPLKSAWCSGRYFSKASTIERTFHTKMPEFQKNSPDCRNTRASSMSGFSVKHLTLLMGLSSETWM